LKNCRNAPPSNLGEIPTPSRTPSTISPDFESSRPLSANSNVPTSDLKNSGNTANNNNNKLHLSTPSPTPVSPLLTPPTTHQPTSRTGRQTAPPALNTAGYRATVALPPQYRTEPPLPESQLANKKKD